MFGFLFLVNTLDAQAACSVKSATFNPSGIQGDDSPSWYKAKSPDRQSVMVEIVTDGCAGKTIEVSLTEEDGGPANDDDLPDSGLDNRKIKVPDGERIFMYLGAGEEACESYLTFGWDCNYYVSVYGLDTGTYTSEGETGGNIVYECDGACHDNWRIESILLPPGSAPTNQVTLYASKSVVGLNEESTITAVLNATDATQIKTLVFTATGTGYSFSPKKTCNITGKGPQSCSVIFKSNQTGNYSIGALVYIGSVRNPGNIYTVAGVSVTVTGTDTRRADTKTTYQPLAPLPGLLEIVETKDDCAFGKYLNIIIKLVLGMAAVLAMVMITWGGVEYITSELVSGKEAGKETIQHALLGLLIALGAWLILNTINPKLLNSCLEIQDIGIKLTADELNFGKTEQSVTSVGTGYKLSGTVSPDVADFVKNHLAKGQPLYAIVVKSSGNRAYFYAGDEKTDNWQTRIYVPVSLGRNGASDVSQVKEGDFKTPRGTTYITSDRRPQGRPPISGQAALTKDGEYNLGAAFINIGATIKGKDRGIGFHGNASNTLATTQGCIRMYNDDLAALAPYMKQGVKVIIE